MKIDYAPTTYHKFALTYDYKPDRVAFCRLMKESWGWQGFSFDQVNRQWVFSDPKIIEAFRERFPEIDVTDQAKKMAGEAYIEEEQESVTAAYIDKLRTEMTSDIVLDKLKAELYPFQKAGVDFLVKSGGRAILADDPGLGKSAQTIGYMTVEDPARTLIVCPATMKYTWQAELTKWSDFTSEVIESDTDLASLQKATRVLIINYDILKKHALILQKVKIDLLVLDEAHYIKSPTALRSKAVKLLAKSVEKIIMLTGTPVLNRPAELFNPLSILDPKGWSSWWMFAHRYCAAHQTRFGLDTSGASNLEELKTKIAKYFLRRTKEEVMKELPQKIRVEVPITLPKEHERLYDKAHDSFAAFLRENKGKKDKEIAKALQAEKLVRLNALREIAANGKVAATTQMIEDLIANGQKVLVFSSFIFPLEQLHEKFGSTSVLITGKTDNEERFEIVKQFQNDPETKLFLGGIKSSGVGITLTAASTVIFIDYSWTPADHKQAEDRAHRIGSTHESITIYTLHAKDTIDDVMKKMLSKKKALVDNIMDEDSSGEEVSAMAMVMAEISGDAIREI